METTIGIIGGTGIYKILEKPEFFEVKTKYGVVSDVSKGKIGNKSVIFLPRHGIEHNVPPHKVNYLANIAVFHKLKVPRILATTAVGSLNSAFPPGDLVLIDQYLDFTKTRTYSFFDGTNGVYHIDQTIPFCPELRNFILEQSKALKIKLSGKGLYACCEGPRFETPAEIKMLKGFNVDVVGMTLVPECILAREMGICYATVAMVTNWAAGISETPLTTKECIETMQKNSIKIKKLFKHVIEKLPLERKCECKNSLKDAGFS
jgi:5'-methylthioadenosine phosphorylase